MTTLLKPLDHATADFGRDAEALLSDLNDARDVVDTLAVRLETMLGQVKPQASTLEAMVAGAVIGNTFYGVHNHLNVVRYYADHLTLDGCPGVSAVVSTAIGLRIADALRHLKGGAQ
jgi:hypothetical protein